MTVIYLTVNFSFIFFAGDIYSLASINKTSKQNTTSKEKVLMQAVQNFIYTAGIVRNLFMTTISLLLG
jgi:hypothetical protein